jgi:glycosyltransferase involved in cell wall biosynthesis
MRTYCIVLHVPVYVDDEGTTYVISSWQRALYLLRDSFKDHFDQFLVVAPYIRMMADEPDIMAIGGPQNDSFTIVPSIPRIGTKKAYWFGGQRKKWLHDVGAALSISQVAHTGMSDLYRPINYDALKSAILHDITTVFTRDTDESGRMQTAIEQAHGLRKVEKLIYKNRYWHAMITAVQGADLSLLKGQDLMELYSSYARNAKMHHDTSFVTEEILDQDTLDARVRGFLQRDRPVKYVYCGRMVARKGCDHSIQIIAAAQQMGADVRLDFIGDGPDRQKLENLVRTLKAEKFVRFLGSMAYNDNLLRKLSSYDALLFTPLSEDTPRMIFDGYAAGLPLVAYDIPYVQERANEEGTTVLLPFKDVNGSAHIIKEINSNRNQLAALALSARKAAVYHAADVWYRRRADWTMEAHERRLHRSDEIS